MRKITVGRNEVGMSTWRRSRAGRDAKIAGYLLIAGACIAMDAALLMFGEVEALAVVGGLQAICLGLLLLSISDQL